MPIQSKGGLPMSLKELGQKGIQAVEEAWCKGNVNAMDEVYDPNIIYHIYPFPDGKGLDAYKHRILDRRKAYENIRFDWEEIIEGGNAIIIRYAMHMKHIGDSPSFPVPPSGKQLLMKGCVVLHIRDDKIVEQFEYDDYLGILQQLGIVQPPKQQ